MATQQQPNSQRPSYNTVASTKFSDSFLLKNILLVFLSLSAEVWKQRKKIMCCFTCWCSWGTSSCCCSCCCWGKPSRRCSRRSACWGKFFSFNLLFVWLGKFTRLASFPSPFLAIFLSWTNLRLPCGFFIRLSVVADEVLPYTHTCGRVFISRSVVFPRFVSFTQLWPGKE